MTQNTDKSVVYTADDIFHKSVQPFGFTGYQIDTAGGRLAQEIMSPDESKIFLWIIILFLEGVFSFAGAMLMTVEGTKRIDRKHR